MDWMGNTTGMTTFVCDHASVKRILSIAYGQNAPSCDPGGVLDFGLDGYVPPGPRDPNPCLEVKKVPMFTDFAQKMDPCLGIFWNFCDFDEKWTHV